MNDEDKTKEQLIKELVELRQQLGQFKFLERVYKHDSNGRLVNANKTCLDIFGIKKPDDYRTWFYATTEEQRKIYARQGIL